MKNISIGFLLGLIGATVAGIVVFFAMYFSLRLPLIDLDNEKTFYLAFYSFIAIVILATVLGATGGVVYSRKYKK